ncbi:MAG: surface-adhesin E family protein [Pseudomonadota bacterium]
MLQWAMATMLMAAAVPAPMSDWVFVDGDGEYSMLTYVDTDSFEDESANHVSALSYTVRAEDSEQGAAAYMVRAEYDCTGSRSRILAIKVFDASKNILLDSSDGDDWTPVQPNTVNASLLTFVCSKGKSETDPVSTGSEPPFDISRQIMREQRNKKQ